MQPVLKYLAIAMTVLGASLAPTMQANAQIIGVITKVVNKVIMAIDLEVQQLQTNTVWLQDAQREVENVMSQTKLNDITGWVQKQRDLYQQYYQELMEVKDAIASYEKVKDIIQKQVLLVQSYQKAYGQFQSDKHFTPDELQYMYQVYSGILTQSVQNLDQIYLVLSAFSLQMGDAERFEMINSAADKIDKNYSDLTEFTRQNQMLSLQRSKDETEAQEVKNLYGLP